MNIIGTINECVQLLVDENRKLCAINCLLIFKENIWMKEKKLEEDGKKGRMEEEEQELMDSFNQTDDFDVL